MQLSIHTYTRAIGIHNTKGQQDRHGGTSPGARMTKKESQRKKATETKKKNCFFDSCSVWPNIFRTRTYHVADTHNSDLNIFPLDYHD